MQILVWIYAVLLPSISFSIAMLALACTWIRSLAPEAAISEVEGSSLKYLPLILVFLLIWSKNKWSFIYLLALLELLGFIPHSIRIQLGMCVFPPKSLLKPE